MLFEFKCKECGGTTERITKADVEEIKCPKCGATAERIISAPHFYIHGYNAANKYSNEKDIKPKGTKT